MTETQKELFPADEKTQELARVQTQVRTKSDEVKSKLKECSAFMTLLKDGPKSVTDIMFRCQHTQLAVDTLKLLSQQADELGTLFLDAMKTCRFVLEQETIANELKAELAAHGIDAEPPTDDDEDNGDEDEGANGSDHEPEDVGSMV